MCAVAIIAAGCHGNPNTSGYGIAWVTVTDEPGDYTSYIVTIDSITLTRNDGAVVTSVATPEIVDFTQVHNIAEMWGSGAIPTGIYVSATITLDYTNAAISVMVDGVPKAATVLDFTTGATPTTYAVTVNFDPQNQPNITPTYASTSASLIDIDFDLAASGRVSLATATPAVLVRPFLTVGRLPADTKLTRVRGPLINSSQDVSTYTVYIRPFYDEANNIGSLTLFSQPSTVYTINGNTYVGAPGLAHLGVLSAGSTMTAGFTTFVPDYNSLNGAYAGKFNLAYVIGASSLEDQYTEGLSGDVIARSGNTLTLLGSTLFLNTADTYSYNVKTTLVTLGPGTIVTADNNTTLTGLSADSVAVGQHISARGIYTLTANGTVLLDATGTSSTNTGSVRLQTTELWGPLVSSASNGLVMDLQAINNWPVSDYNFTGNGATAAQNPQPAAFSVNPAGLSLPIGTGAGDLVWIDGFATRFGSAPPDFYAVSVNNESSVQVAGAQAGGGLPTTPGTQMCGVGSQVCEPASLQVLWVVPPGTITPFEAVSGTGFSINLGNAYLATAVIRIGPESIDLKSLPASPLIVPTTLPVTTTFAPQYAFGNPDTASTTSTVTSTTALKIYSNFDTFITGLQAAMDAANPAKQLEARGVYNRATNTFTATSIDFVL
jgi:hypothetical protein